MKVLKCSAPWANHVQLGFLVRLPPVIGGVDIVVIVQNASSRICGLAILVE